MFSGNHDEIDQVGSDPLGEGEGEGEGENKGHEAGEEDRLIQSTKQSCRYTIESVVDQFCFFLV